MSHRPGLPLIVDRAGKNELAYNQAWIYIAICGGDISVSISLFVSGCFAAGKRLVESRRRRSVLTEPRNK